MLLFIVMAALALWIIGTSLMYIHAKRIMREGGRDSTDGEHKAIISLFLAMYQELNLDFPSLHLAGNISEHNLQSSVRDMQGGSITYTKITSVKSHSRKTGLITHIRDVKWWFVAFLSLLGVAVTLGIFPLYSNFVMLNTALVVYFWCANFGPLLGTFSACLIGTTTGSRVVIASILTLVFYLASIPILLRW